MSKKKKNRNGKAKTGSNGSGARGRTRAAQAEAPKSPPNLRARAWVTVGALIVVQGGVWAAREFALPSGTREVTRPLAELPLELGEFTGDDKEQDPRMFAAIGAEQSISRMYTRADGAPLLLHVGVWDGAENWMPHPPDGCYPAAGWRPARQESIELDTQPRAEAAIREFEQGGQTIQVLYWYRLGEITYHDKTDTRTARRQLMGERQWPPVVKVMLQAGPGEANERMLKDFAVLVDAWTKEL